MSYRPSTTHLEQNPAMPLNRVKKKGSIWLRIGFKELWCWHTCLQFCSRMIPVVFHGNFSHRATSLQRRQVGAKWMSDVLVSIIERPRTHGMMVLKSWLDIHYDRAADPLWRLEPARSIPRNIMIPMNITTGYIPLFCLKENQWGWSWNLRRKHMLYSVDNNALKLHRKILQFRHKSMTYRESKAQKLNDT